MGKKDVRMVWGNEIKTGWEANKGWSIKAGITQRDEPKDTTPKSK